jgi:hypothetical protein
MSLLTGDQILVVWDSVKGEIRRARIECYCGGDHWRFHTDTSQRASLHGGGLISAKDEGMTWIRGWDEEAEGALHATWTLADEPTLVDTETATRRWASGRPNISNRPKAA